MQEDLYSLLDVPKSAAPEEIKKAFKKKAVEFHPDKTNGDKTKEEMFKKINEAYATLSDPKKRQMYDQFGVVGDGPPPGQGGFDMGDILKGMFGGMPGMSSARDRPFSFVFMNEDGPASMDEEIFGNMFGNQRHGRHEHCDVINVSIDICDLYYGKTKNMEFELLEQCTKCNGIGAQDPSAIIKCMTCKGEGHVFQQFGPFMQKARCPSCAGTGSIIKNGKHCNTCKGQKTVFNKKHFKLKLPKGIQNGYEVKMEGKGSYDVNIKKNKDLLIKLVHNILEPYSVDDQGHVVYNLTIDIEDLMGGFEKEIKLYDENIVIKSDRYFNPNKHVVVPGMGLMNTKRNKHADLHLKFNIEFCDSDRLSKYNDIFHKILKRSNKDTTHNPDDSKKIINIQEL